MKKKIKLSDTNQEGMIIEEIENELDHLIDSDLDH